MICPSCEHDNLPGVDECVNCRQDLTQLDRPVPQDRVELSLMEDAVSVLNPRPPVTIALDATIGAALDVLLRHDIGALLVVDAGGKLVGIFSERDLLMKVTGQVDDYRPRGVAEFMTRDPVTVRGTDTLAFALHKMAVGGYRHLPVVQDDVLVGMVSVRDLLGHVTSLCDRAGQGGRILG